MTHGLDRRAKHGVFYCCTHFTYSRPIPNRHSGRGYTIVTRMPTYNFLNLFISFNLLIELEYLHIITDQLHPNTRQMMIILIKKYFKKQIYDLSRSESLNVTWTGELSLHLTKTVKDCRVVQLFAHLLQCVQRRWRRQHPWEQFTSDLRLTAHH